MVKRNQSCRIVQNYSAEFIKVMRGAVVIGDG